MRNFAKNLPFSGFMSHKLFRGNVARIGAAALRK